MSLSLKTPACREPDNNTDVESYISPSRLSLFLQCRERWRRRYILGEVTPTTSAMNVGSAVHSTLKAVYGSNQIPTDEQLGAIVKKSWETTMSESPCQFDYADHETHCQEQVHGLVSAYMAAIPIANEKPIALEQQYRAPLIDPANNENLGVDGLGIIDLVLDGGDTDKGNACNSSNPIVIDFKTCATAPLYESQHFLQLTMYSYLYRQTIGVKEKEVQIRQLVKHKVPKIFTHRFCQRTEEKHFKLMFDIVRLYLDALEKKNFVAQPGYQCSLCPHCRDCC